MHLIGWILTSLAISTGPVEADMAVELEVGIAERPTPSGVLDDGADEQKESKPSDSCTNWRLAGPEHCRWMYKTEIDAYLSCVRAIERACQERAQTDR